MGQPYEPGTKSFRPKYEGERGGHATDNEAAIGSSPFGPMPSRSTARRTAGNRHSLTARFPPSPRTPTAHRYNSAGSALIPHAEAGQPAPYHGRVRVRWLAAPSSSKSAKPAPA